ncbi:MULTISPECIES: hypothetical protein [Photorhabdus]|uniref:Uncharacterized protein n=2 Tax=Photorhabdus TaxID=29487 RepID=A0AAW6BIV1_9GAMM|nr:MULTISPECIES: hypothetical protein [Photorhabdus]KGM27693.1 hypothetical protein KS18_12415 [Photorhabdus luminescens]MCC8457184.1 hypothetical protein [Photorhabdus aegyptia]MCC8465539.1 hypothetical protein [Photorhabdus bodei]MDB6372716.1 hypothetical protein [Photorhabdus bodei]PQQ40384.1 hypothetical protein C6H65_15505 [Photorhabdus luminescens]
MNLSLRSCLAVVLFGGVLSVPSFSAGYVDSRDGCSMLSFKVGETICSLDDLKTQYQERREIVDSLANEISQYYLNLLSLDESQVRGILLQNDNDIEINKACETTIRGFEQGLKAMLKQDRPDEEKQEMRMYLRSIAKARFEITRLNDFSRQLFTLPKIYKSDINKAALSELAAYTTKKIESGNFSFTG